jgi:NAD(P)-dependent dehydrogenase (short-subunit alcohol dehydrogenase family)
MKLHPAFGAGKVAVITGAADGIGRAAAERCAGLGMHVLLADIESTRLAEAVAAVRAAAPPGGGRVAALRVDVAQLTEVEALRELAYTTFGQVDVLMNNAGTSVPTTSWQGLGDWRRLFEVNLWGVLHGVHAFTEAMIAQGTPAVIVNTGSKQGITNPPGNPAYNATKAAVKSATESLQHSLRNTQGCQVSAHLLVPGYTYTGLTRRRVSEKPAGAWSPLQVVDYLLEALARGSFYVICPDNEVSRTEDARRMLWAAGDLAFDRSALSRWDPAWQQAYAEFKP